MGKKRGNKVSAGWGRLETDGRKEGWRRVERKVEGRVKREGRKEGWWWVEREGSKEG